MGMFIEKICGGVVAGLRFGGFADLFDFGRGDHGGLVAEGVSHVGQDGGDLLIAELFEGGHGNLARVLFAVDFDGAEEAVQGDLDEAFFASLDPFGLAERGKHGGGESCAIGLVAGDAVTFAAVNFRAFLVEGEGFAFERVGGWADFFDLIAFDFLPFEMGFGSRVDGFDPVVERLLGDSGEDWDAFFWGDPRGGDGGFQADA